MSQVSTEELPEALCVPSAVFADVKLPLEELPRPGDQAGKVRRGLQQGRGLVLGRRILPLWVLLLIQPLCWQRGRAGAGWPWGCRTLTVPANSEQS